MLVQKNTRGEPVVAVTAEVDDGELIFDMAKYDKNVRPQTCVF